MRKSLFSMLMLVALVLLQHTGFTQEQYATFSSYDGYTGTWTCPEGVTSLTVYSSGAGGAGGSAYGNGVAGGGGAGGSFSQKTITVVPGTVYNYSLGMGGQPTDPTQAAYGGNGGNTWFGSPETAQAQGGNGGQNGSGVSTGTLAGEGGIGSIANNVGDINYVGGSGAAGNTLPGSQYGGGGGGSAGQGSDGFSATGQYGGEGGMINGAYGGDGGGGFSSIGQAPDNPNGGAGGGGAFSHNFFLGWVLGGTGGDGKMLLVWNLPLAIHIESFSGNKTDKGNTLHLTLNTTNEQNIEVHLEKNAGNKTWNAIAQQKVSNENMRHAIDFTDDNLTANFNQYRVKVITDGAVKYSNIVAIGNDNKTVAAIKMVPNPSANTGVLNIQSLANEHATIIITDITGKTILSKAISLGAGNNAIELNLSDVVAGNYQAAVVNQQGGATTVRFVKQ